MKHLINFLVFESNYSGDENFIPKSMLNKTIKNTSKSLNHSLNNNSDSIPWADANDDLFIGRSEREEKRNPLKSDKIKLSDDDFLSKAEFRIIQRDKIEDLDNKIELLKDFYRSNLNPEYRNRIRDKYYDLMNLKSNIKRAFDIKTLKKLASLEADDLFDFYNKYFE